MENTFFIPDGNLISDVPTLESIFKINAFEPVLRTYWIPLPGQDSSKETFLFLGKRAII